MKQASKLLLARLAQSDRLATVLEFLASARAAQDAGRAAHLGGDTRELERMAEVAAEYQQRATDLMTAEELAQAAEALRAPIRQAISAHARRKALPPADGGLTPLRVSV